MVAFNMGVCAVRVMELWRYPVKSMQGERVTSTAIGPLGIAGDRQFGVLDQQTNVVLSARRAPALLQCEAKQLDGVVVITLPDGQACRAQDADPILSEFLGRNVQVLGARNGDETLDWNSATGSGKEPLEAVLPQRLWDSSPVHLLSTRCIAQLATTHRHHDWSVRRFRPNVVVELAPHESSEDEWQGEFALGSALCALRKPTARCVVTTRAQPGIEVDKAILQIVSAERDGDLGIYAYVQRPGIVAVDS